MPKKFIGENSKAVAAKAHKEAQKSERNEKEVKAKEDQHWAEDDKNVLKKQQRREEEERRKLQAAEKKRENAKLYEAEMSKLQSGGATTAAKAGNRKPTTPKVTMAALEALRQEDLKRRAEQRREEEDRLKKIEVLSEEIEENVNRVNAGSTIATSVDDAIKALASLDSGDQADRHPEKRMRAAYNAFMSKRLPELKCENPTLRLSQLRELLHKEWQKSPENPIRQQRV